MLASLTKKSQINKLEQYLADNIALREAFFDAKRSELKMFENRLIERIDAEGNERKESDKSLTVIITNKANAVKVDLGKESVEREESVNYLKDTFEVRLFPLI